MGNSTEKTVSKGKMSSESFITLFMFGVLLLLFGVACAFVPNFYKLQNIINLFTNYWFIILIGIGATFILITGNLDMSVGGIISLAGVLAVYFSQAANSGSTSALSNGLGLPYGLAIFLALCGALVIGAINAFFIARLKVASIIITLGTMSLARGIAQIITQGAQRNTNLPDVFGVLGNITVVGSVKLSVFIMIALVALAALIEKKTIFGRRTYLIGANAEAARLSGVKVSQHISLLYLNSALLAGIAGVLMASEFKSGLSNRAVGYEFDALVITLLGGTSIMGGFGSVLGTVVGALILSVVTSAATGLLLTPDWQFMIKGIVTFLAILAQRFALERRKS